MTSWKDQFIAIEDSIIASEGVNDLSNDRYSNASCGCVPNFPGDAICKDSKCINFSTQSECSKCREGCCNKRIQNRKYAKLNVIETPGKGHGLFAAENLQKLQFVMEYVGELISPQDFKKRSSDKSCLLEHQYIMQLKNGVYLDAGRKGSISRFINHSCEPNCFVEVWTVQGRLRVGIFTMVSIPAGTELTFDYQWRPSTRPPTRCHCGTEFCRGYLEVFSKEELDLMKVHNGLWRRGGEPISKQQQQGRAVSPATSQSPSESVADASTATTLVVPAAPVDDVYTPERLLIPSKMIGKHVKVWWEGNLAFLEADVESFNAKTGMYTCRYVVDDTVCEEDFGPSVGSTAASSSTYNTTGNGSGSTSNNHAPSSSSIDLTAAAAAAVSLNNIATKWFWMDDTLENPMIKKKAESDTISGDYVVITAEGSAENVDNSTPPTNNNSSATVTTTSISSSTSNIAGSSFLAVPAVSRSMEIVTFPTAQYFISMHSSSADAAVKKLGAQCRFLTHADYGVWQNLQHICNRNYRVKPMLYDCDTTSDGSNTYSSSKRVVFIGQSDDLVVVQTLMRQAEKASVSNVSSVAKLHLLSLRNQQSRILTQDWRFLPEYISAMQQQSVAATSTSTTALLDDDSFVPYYARKLLKMPVLSGCLPVQHLPISVRARCALVETNSTEPQSSSNNGSSTALLPESQLRTLLAHIHTLCATLNYTAPACLHAQTLLVRYVRYLPSMLTKDMMVVLAAILSIVAKCTANYKHKLLITIIQATYCQVFNRDSSSVSAESVEPYLSICIDRERLIYTQLQYDIYYATVFPTLYAALRASMNTEKWYFEHETTLSGVNMEVSEQKHKRRDREGERLKHKQVATYQYESNIRSTVRRAVLNASEALAYELFYLRTNSSNSNSNNKHTTSNSSSVAAIRATSTSADGILALYALPIETVQLGCVMLVCILYKLLPSGNTHKRVYKELSSYLAEVVTVALRSLSLSPAMLQWVTEVVAGATWTCLSELGHVEPVRELRESVPSADQEVLLRGDLPAALTTALAELETPPPLAVGGVSTVTNSSGITSTSTSTATPFQLSNSYSIATSTARLSLSHSNNNAICKMRFPWLSQESNASTSSTGTAAVYLETGVSFDDLQSDKRQLMKQTEKELPIIATAKDLYFGLATTTAAAGDSTSTSSTATTSANFLPSLHCQSTQHSDSINHRAEGQTSAAATVGLMSLRPWPSHKHLDKEVARAGVQEASQLGVLAAAAKELTLLQHIHYFYSSSGSSGSAGECPYFIVPVGVLALSRGEFASTPQLRRVLLHEKQAATARSSSIDAYTLKTHSDSGSTMQVDPHADQRIQSASSAVKYETLQYLAFPAVHLSLAQLLGLNIIPNSPRWEISKRHLQQQAECGRVLAMLEDNRGHLLSPVFAVELVRDLLLAVQHMTACGVFLKWLNIEHIYITPGGRLQVGGLSGAVMADTSTTTQVKSNNGYIYGVHTNTTSSNGNSSSTDQADDPFSLLALSNQISLIRNSNRVTKADASSKSRMKRKYNIDDEEEDDVNNSAGRVEARMISLLRRMALPRSVLYTVAPEVLFGAAASQDSTMYTACTVAVQILTGRSLVKNASSEEKQVQYLYRTLGTPKTLGYTDFEALPLSAHFGRSIVDDQDDSRRSESRCRVYKLLSELCPPALLALYSFTQPPPQQQQPTENYKKENKQSMYVHLSDAHTLLAHQADGPSDHEGVLDLLRTGLQLIPQRRLSAELLLQFAIFQQDPQTLQRSSTTTHTGHRECLDFTVQTVAQLTSTGLTLSATTLTAQSRVRCMEGLVATLRVLQRIPIPESVAKKDATYTAVSAEDVNTWCTVDEALFREERVKASAFVHTAAADTVPTDFTHRTTVQLTTVQSRHIVPTAVAHSHPPAAASVTRRWGPSPNALPSSALPATVSPHNTYSDYSTYSYGRPPSAAGGSHLHSQQHSYSVPTFDRNATLAASPYAHAGAAGYPSPAVPVPSLSLPPLPVQPPVPTCSPDIPAPCFHSQH